MVFLLLAIAAVLLAVSWRAPLIGDQWLRPLEQYAARFSRRKSLTILSLGLAAVLARLALLPVLPVPLPAVHDEFSYLLAADTFTHGRLANPQHPMWVFFDTFHVLQHPTYASKYPPAPGAAMAVGQLLGHPWIGVLLSTATMVMAMTWMLQGWFSPPWALLGGVLVWLRLGVFAHWIDSYYNGSVPVIGAALVLGAFPRTLRFGRARDALLMGAGAMILACSRPVEGLIFCLPVSLVLPMALWSRHKDNLRAVFARAILPLGAVLICGLLFLAYYNARVTGSPLQFPYVLYHRQYFNYPAFAWQKASPSLHYDNPQFETFFNVWQRHAYPLTREGWENRSWGTVWGLWLVLLGPVLTVPFLTLGRVLKDHRMRLPLTQFLLSTIGLLCVVWFQPHYAGPLAAALFVLLAQAMRHLRHVVIRGRPIGIFLTRLVVILALDWVVIQAGHAARYPVVGWSTQRAQVIKTLDAVPGKHLVLVRYAPGHNVHQEWVYNAADIDHSRIVWAREIPGRDLKPLLDYFRDRKIWVVQPDTVPSKLQLYTVTALANGP
ncbi:MAG: hypothetical protein WA628_06550 [Terriglobales bacterium]